MSNDADLIAEAREPNLDGSSCYDFPDGAFDSTDVRELLGRLAHALEARNAEVVSLRNTIEKARQIEPFRFADADDPERTPGDPVIWKSELDAVLALLVPTSKENDHE